MPSIPLTFPTTLCRLQVLPSILRLRQPHYSGCVQFIVHCVPTSYRGQMTFLILSLATGFSLWVPAGPATLKDG